MTAKTPDGKVVYHDSKIYMPVPHQLGRLDRMGRGPYDKSGILVDWALHPLEEKKEDYRILVPAKEGKPESLEYIVEFELWYHPFGNKDDYSQLWRKTTQKIKFTSKEPY